ncbi:MULTISPECIES: TonB-dependent receptor [unclassified Spirosoma]|uniref:SusC/RagA family TonB-linked outer membrane protein n=1 Tax=unclassified Spirosoma TaxID=2621999 RepID=UPI00095E4B4F|nr:MULTISPECIES: TonB-dependent receptor [unclassified Spirosoma]MBN8820798.1 TonB-dependent receptor [Spirosoma sp.]OJW72918.1 MAG: hypothetical protein BGO59_09245 [Spirosoma sp. 48-14]
MKLPRPLCVYTPILMRLTLTSLLWIGLFMHITFAENRKVLPLLEPLVTKSGTNQEVSYTPNRQKKIEYGPGSDKPWELHADQLVSSPVTTKRLASVLDQPFQHNAFTDEAAATSQKLLSNVANLRWRTRNLMPKSYMVENIPAADRTIRGTVKGETGTSLPGVTVLVKNTSRGTTTDVDGTYSLAIPDEATTLVFSFVGYLSQEINVGERAIVNVQLAPDQKSLSEVVVVGYGTQRRASVTSAVASLNAQDINNQITKNPLEAMAGQLAGVAIQQSTGKPGSNPVVRVRGTGSLTAGNTPLYVVDGMPLQNSDDFSLINPADIETIDVLKDAASAAIYGSRGGNGVVLVTTRKGKAGQSRIDFSYYTGIQQVSKKMKLMNRDEHIDLIKEGVLNNWLSVGGDPSVPNGQRRFNGQLANFNYPASYDNPNSLPDTDWQNLIFRSAPISNYQLSAQGGTDKTRYYVSGNYFSQAGIIKATDYERYSFRLNLDANPTSYLRLGMSFSPSYAKENRRPTDGHWNVGDAGIIQAALVMPPTIQPYYPGGLYGQILGNNEYATATSYVASVISPLNVLENPNYKDIEERARLLGVGYAELTPVKGLVIRTNLGLDFRNYWNNYYRPSTANDIGTGVLTPGQPNPNINNIVSRHSEFRNLNYAWDNTATYHRQINDVHDLTVLAGYSVQRNSDESTGTMGPPGRFDNDLVTYVTAASLINGSGGKEEWSLLSYLGRINYGYKERYLLTAAVRRDGSSRFAANHKWAVFPSVSVGWRVSEEPFLKNIHLLSDLKLRASYGVTGNFNIGNYRSVALLGKDNYNFGLNDGTLATGYAPSNAANPNLTWETNRQTDVGLDIGVFNNRFSLSADYYYRITDGLLYNRPVPGSSGFTTVYGNIGTIENKGFELAINSVNTTGALRWTTNFNFSLNRNKVIQLGDKNEPIRTVSQNTVTQVTQVGRPFADFYGYPIDGIFRNQADVDANPAQKFNSATRPGDTKFVDTNGDGKITPDDRTILGNPQADFLYGMTNRITYRGFSLDVQFQGVQGGKIVLLTSRFIGNNNLSLNNLQEPTINRWRSETNPGEGVQPRISSTNYPSSGLNESLLARYLQDGTYLRLRNVTLAYNLPSAFAKKAHLAGARVFASGQNLFTLSKYIGYNPEVSQNGEDVTTPGIDYGVYPLARTITVGLTLSL